MTVVRRGWDFMADGPVRATAKPASPDRRARVGSGRAWGGCGWGRGGSIVSAGRRASRSRRPAHPACEAPGTPLYVSRHIGGPTMRGPATRHALGHVLPARVRARAAARAAEVWHDRAGRAGRG